ncbi:hypothetical protein SI859A1_02926 [Aurantimonas manganoxydans SI85-9A1]|uniref:Uncharacterized protein n=1 Tax=Aurantimonas manganoxydans (strain ATCC BAA-1229 / DSM 21871 / SI85-9A1) TaxID=287752 RepID=Q1YGA0_AURMS|nr:hypothetical protein SI859A1_02926 [Aurantimonas manganoxydans SI85-9A1]
MSGRQGGNLRVQRLAAGDAAGIGQRDAERGNGQRTGGVVGDHAGDRQDGAAAARHDAGIDMAQDEARGAGDRIGSGDRRIGHRQKEDRRGEEADQEAADDEDGTAGAEPPGARGKRRAGRGVLCGPRGMARQQERLAQQVALLGGGVGKAAMAMAGRAASEGPPAWCGHRFGTGRLVGDLAERRGMARQRLAADDLGLAVDDDGAAGSPARVSVGAKVGHRILCASAFSNR